MLSLAEENHVSLFLIRDIYGIALQIMDNSNVSLLTKPTICDGSLHPPPTIIHIVVSLKRNFEARKLMRQRLKHFNDNSTISKHSNLLLDQTAALCANLFQNIV